MSLAGQWWVVECARSTLLIVAVVTAMAAGLFLAIPARGATQIPFLVTQVPRQNGSRPSAPASPLSQVHAERGRIVLVSADGRQRVLTSDFHSAADPAVSFDAKRMLFAAKRTAAQPWDIYEMVLENLICRQITHDSGNCRQPGYQSTLYTIISAEPWYQLTFVSDVANTINENGAGAAQSLYSCKLDGSEVRRLTYNLSDDADPFLMPDGRLVYASWQRSTLQRGAHGRVALFGVNIDGTDHALFGDLRGLPVKRMPCLTDRGLVLFLESEFGGDGSGQISAVSFRRPLHSYRTITASSGGYVYRNLRPWPDGRVLASRRALAGDTDYGICLFDPKTATATALLDDPQYDDVQAEAIRVRREPDGRSSVVSEDDPHGKLYCLNVNIDDFTDRTWHPPGTARRVRFLEGVPLDVHQGDCYLPPLAESARFSGSSRNGIPQLVQRRILGEIDISADGSFNVEVPANTPIQLQTVDENGAALRTCGWIWSKNHEPRGCIGCHEDGELTPENAFVDALKGRSIALTLPADRRRTVDFRRDVMPIIERKCVPCHGPDGAVPRLDGGGELVSDGGEPYFNRAYLNLLARNGDTGPGADRRPYVDPGQARTSPLIWHLFDRNLARPWDGDTAQAEVKPIPQTNADAPSLSEGDRRTFVEWVDMGALWDGIPGTEN